MKLPYFHDNPSDTAQSGAGTFRRDTNRTLRELVAESSKIRSTSVFLTELIITVFLFALTSIVCVDLFVAARKISRASSGQTTATHFMQNAAEAFYEAEGGPGETLAILTAADPGLSVRPDPDEDSPVNPQQEGNQYSTGTGGDYDRYGQFIVTLPGNLTAQLSFQENSGEGKTSSGAMHRLRIRVLETGGNEILTQSVDYFVPDSDSGQGVSLPGPADDSVSEEGQESAAGSVRKGGAQ